MRSLQRAIVASLLFLLASKNGAMAEDRNITVVNTDPAITYEGPNTGNATICQIDSNGFIQSGQPGCYDVPSMCAASVTMNMSPSTAASMKFKGSAIYINSVLSSISPLFDVTLDGKTTTIDGVRDSRRFSCFTLFSATKLDPTVEHTIRLSINGTSPTRDMAIDADGNITLFSLINMTYTVPDPIPSAASRTLASISEVWVLVVGLGAVLGIIAGY
ncbi:hypothetical protein B0H34DRAFT_795480 [Crassisporium funariophilum]|nr:hypothetical protein B0H34DRAFT_795480 [Crassisporium funariophilum]